MLIYKDKSFCSNSQFCTEDCPRRLTEEDREVVSKGAWLVGFSDFTGTEICTHEKVGTNESKTTTTTR